MSAAGGKQIFSSCGPTATTGRQQTVCFRVAGPTVLPSVQDDGEWLHPTQFGHEAPHIGIAPGLLPGHHQAVYLALALADRHLEECGRDLRLFPATVLGSE